MRVEKAIKNVSISVASSVFLFLVGLLVRKILLNNFDVELVAYDGLLNDIFSYVTLADLGVDGLFSYRLYKAFANDKNKLNKLVSMYRCLYICFGFIIIGLCIILSFFLPSIFSNKVHLWNYFYIMYALYAIQAASSYFFGYWRAVIVASQEEHVAIEIESALTFLGLICKVFVLLLTKNYLLYIAISIGINVLSRILVYLKGLKKFPDIKYTNVKYIDFKEEGMLKECGQLVIIKASDVITWCSANILITLLFDLKTSAYYYNYALIGTTLFTMITKIIAPMTASIADMIYKEDKETSYDYYKTLDLVFFFVSAIVFVGYTCVFQNAITTIYGDEYLLSMLFVFVYGLQYYFATRSDFVASFRNCFGDFHIENKYSIASAIIGVIISIVFGRIVGVSGVVIGIIVAILIIWQCRFVIVIRNFFNKKIKYSWINEIKYLFIALIEFTVTYLITKGIDYSLLGLVYRIVLSVVVPTTINVILFSHTTEFKNTIDMIKNLLISRKKK